MHQRTLVFLAWASSALAAASTTFAEPFDDDEEGMPAGFERFEVSDLTFTMRDDAYSALLVDPVEPKTAYAGSHQGRFYKTTDGGRTWTESTIIPEQGLLWQAPGATIFFGGIRASGDRASSVDLIGARPSPTDFANVPSQLRRPSSTNAPDDPLDAESGVSAGAGASFLGVGLSERSPRLSLLTASRGRPVPTLSRVRFLSESALRGTSVFNITVDPDDGRLLYAATSNGLYKSYDGGESWARIFAGLTSAERKTLRIAIRPGEPKLLILGTMNGAYTSVNDGDSWTKIATVGGAVNDVAFDPKDPDYVYVATNGGVLRSDDGGRRFVPIYYSTFPPEGDVRQIVIDPFDAETGYIGTQGGVFVTGELRTAKLDDWRPLASVRGVAVPKLAACSKHRGHLYALTRLDLHTIVYGAAPPGSAVLETWDRGRTWRRLFTGHSAGLAETMAVDAKDPDQLWIAWSLSLHRIVRGRARRTANAAERDADDGPPIGEIVRAALVHHGLELEDYTEKIAGARSRSLLPRAITVTGTFRQWSAGGLQDDAQFSAGRYYQIADAREWAVTVWASWSLPERVYSRDSVPMLRQRIQILNDELRRRISESIYLNYGELLRIRAVLASAPSLDVETRVIYGLRIEQLEAVVDLASGGYLTRWHKKHRRNAT